MAMTIRPPHRMARPPTMTARKLPETRSRLLMTPPLASKGDGADQLIKTFGILPGADGRALRTSRRVWPCCALGGEFSNQINRMLSVQSCRQKYFDSRRTQITSISLAFRPDGG